MIPIKAFARAKSRLAGTLTARDRARLARGLASQAIAAARSARGIDSVFALVSDPRTAAWATQRGATPLADGPRTSFSQLISRTIDALAARGAGIVVYLAGDLADIDGADIEQLLAIHAGGLTLAAASRDGGTNAFVCDAPRKISFAFGPGSAARHLSRARRAGLRATRVSLPAFSHDIDTAEDLVALRGGS